jgi:hypothetical protein
LNQLPREQEPNRWGKEPFVSAISRGISLWPPDGAPQELVDLLCPWKKAAEDQASSDERTLIYSVSNAEEGQTIILISFDAEIRFLGLKLLQTSETKAQDMYKGSCRCGAATGWR